MREYVSAEDCCECEQAMFTTSVGITHHGDPATEEVDYDTDADHVPFHLNGEGD